MSITNMKFHPYSEIFPLFDDAEFDALVDDIKAHGLREQIWLYEGKILDGRNRFLACKTAKVEPKFREFKGEDALAFVVSVNMQRRHLTTEQRSLAAARVATLQKGGDPNAPRDALTQAQAADKFDVSRRSVQRARQVVEKGSKALQHAVEKGEVPLKKAAAVVDLPKPEQLSAAKAPAEKPEPPELDQHWVPDDDEDEKLALAEKEYSESIDKVMAADDKLAAARDEIKRQAAEIATLRTSRDGYMNGKLAVTKLLKAEQRKVDRLTAELDKLRTKAA